VLVIDDSTGSQIGSKLNLASGQGVAYYDIHWEDGSGNRVNTTDSVTVTLPLPSNMNPDSGTVEVYTLDSSGNLIKLSATVTKDGNNASVTFTTDHYTEYALVYTPTGTSSVSNNSGRTSTGTTTGTNSTNTSYINNGKSAGSDMPKTGDAETYRTILFALGGLLIGMKLILTATGKKTTTGRSKRRR